MALALVQKAGSATGAVAFGSNNTAGNLLVAVVRNSSAVTDTLFNNWRVAASSSNCTILYVPSCLAGANTATGAGANCIVVAEFSGAAKGLPLDQTSGLASGTSAAYLSTTLTISQAIELLIGGVTNETLNSLTNTPGSGWADIGANGAGNAFMNYEIISAAGAFANNGGLSSSVNWHAAAASFIPSTAGAGIVCLQSVGSNPSGSNPTAAFASNTTGGSILFAIMGSEVSAPTYTGVPTDTLLNTWIQIGTAQTLNGVANAAAVYYCINNASGGANTVTFHQTGGGQLLVGLIEFTGQALVNPVDQFAFSQISTTGSVQNLTPVSFTGTNEAVISIGIIAAAFIQSFGGLYTLPFNLRGGVGVSAEFGYFASGPQTPSATITTGQTMLSLSISLLTAQPSTGGGGGQGNQPIGNVIFDLDSGGFPIAELQTGTDA